MLLSGQHLSDAQITPRQGLTMAWNCLAVRWALARSCSSVLERCTQDIRSSPPSTSPSVLVLRSFSSATLASFFLHRSVHCEPLI